MYPGCDYSLSLGKPRSRNCGFLSGPKAITLVAYLNSIVSINKCIVIDLIPVLALMPMPYYIFPNAFSGPKTRRGDVPSAPACVSPPPPLPSTALLRCTALCALGRGPVCEGVAAGWRASQTARRTAFAPRACSPNWTRAPPVLTQVRSVPPLRLDAAMAPHLSSDTEAPLS
jgi:hypothetical protein